MKVACVTLDTEPDLRSDRCDIELFRNQEQLGLFQEIISRYEVKLTGFLVTKILQYNPDLVEKALASLPIRFESHSHNHNPHDTDSEKELDESIAWYEKFFGHPPKGYRAPNGLISRSGLSRLAERGFVYDSSIFPSLRLDEYSYNHLRLPIHPYVVRGMGRTLIELPLAVIRRIRLVVSVSHIKLLGWRFYDPLIQLFGLPDVVIIDSHPYDYFVGRHLNRIPGWKRWAHARNAENALPFLERLLRALKTAGYTFLYIDDLLRVLEPGEMTQVEISEI